MTAEWTLDASPSAEAILRARDMLRLQVRQLYEREGSRPWPQEEGDPLVAPATEPVKRAFDALRAAGQRLDEALMALHAYAPDHAAEIAHIREIRTWGEVPSLRLVRLGQPGGKGSPGLHGVPSTRSCAVLPKRSGQDGETECEAETTSCASSQLVLRPPRWCAPSNAAPGSAGPESRYLGPRPPPQGQRSPAERVEAQPTWRNLRSGDRWRPAKVSPWPDVLQVILPVGPPARTEPVIRCPRNRRRIAPIAGPSWAVGPDGIRRGDANRLIALGRPTIPRVAAERERARNRLAVRQHRERRGPLRNTPFENP
jgi:hypothetical protein